MSLTTTCTILCRVPSHTKSQHLYKSQDQERKGHYQVGWKERGDNKKTERERERETNTVTYCRLAHGTSTQKQEKTIKKQLNLGTLHQEKFNQGDGEKEKNRERKLWGSCGSKKQRGGEALELSSPQKEKNYNLEMKKWRKFCETDRAQW